MPRGGKRSGAGRPKGTLNKNRTIIHSVRQEIEQGKQKSPIEVMIFIMNKSLEDENYTLALNVAGKVAPYIHPKLNESKVEMTNIRRPEDMSEEELLAFIGKNA